MTTFAGFVGLLRVIQRGRFQRMEYLEMSVYKTQSNMITIKHPILQQQLLNHHQGL